MNADGMRAEIARLSKIVTDAGGKVTLMDYGISAAAQLNDKGVWLVQQFRPERDGHWGAKVIADDVLTAWLESNAPTNTL